MATEPTTTTFALLGLLATRPLAAYDLTQQMRRALRWAWPRSEANLYSEAKRLVRLGYARATKERHGKRTRTVYSITDEGREALRSWLGEDPEAAPQCEAEALLRVFFADHGDVADLRATLTATRRHVREVAAELLPVLEEYEARAGPFPERTHLNVLFGAFFARHYRTVLEWCDLVEAQLDEWPSVAGVGETPPIREILEETTGFYREVLAALDATGRVPS